MINIKCDECGKFLCYAYADPFTDFLCGACQGAKTLKKVPKCRCKIPTYSFDCVTLNGKCVIACTSCYGGIEGSK